MELGEAASIGVEQITGDWIESDVNKWLRNNPSVEVIEIKMSSSATKDGMKSDALIIYRKEV